MNNLPADISNRIIWCLSHPLADLLNHEIKINNEYIQELIDFGHFFFRVFSNLFRN